MDLLTMGITDLKHKAGIETEEIGATAEMKMLYEARSSCCTCCKVWDDEKPVDREHAEIRELAEKQHERWAILQKAESSWA